MIPGKLVEMNRRITISCYKNINKKSQIHWKVKWLQVPKPRGKIIIQRFNSKSTRFLI